MLKEKKQIAKQIREIAKEKGATVIGIANLGGFVAASLWNVPEGGMPMKSTETVIHEIGHNQGLAHIYCPNASSPAAGADPSYPYADGHIGIWGFSIRSFELYPPDIGHDYMTYCASQWPSTAGTTNRIPTLATSPT